MNNQLKTKVRQLNEVLCSSCKTPGILDENRLCFHCQRFPRKPPPPLGWKRFAGFVKKNFSELSKSGSEAVVVAVGHRIITDEPNTAPEVKG
jgi:hypothetical protein